jgi:hypothetical protein
MQAGDVQPYCSYTATFPGLARVIYELEIPGVYEMTNLLCGYHTKLYKAVDISFVMLHEVNSL